MTAGTGQPVLPCSEDELPQSIQLAKQDAPMTIPPDTQGNRHRQKSASVKVAEQTVMAPKENEQDRRDLPASRITVCPEFCETRAELPHQPPVQPGQKDTRLDPQSDVEDNQRKLVDVKDAEHIGTESEEIARLRRDLSESRSQVAELQKCCEAQSKDLEGSKNFFNATDRYSDSDVIQACRRLNAELQQTTLQMVDYLMEKLEFQDVATNSTKERVLAVHKVSDHIGQVLAESLATPDTGESIPMLLQIAFQACLASALSTATTCWTSEPGYNAFIYEIYQRLRSVGEEPSALMGPAFYLTRRNLVNRGASHLWTLAHAYAHLCCPRLQFPPKSPRRRDPHRPLSRPGRCWMHHSTVWHRCTGYVQVSGQDKLACRASCTPWQDA